MMRSRATGWAALSLVITVFLSITLTACEPSDVLAPLPTRMVPTAIPTAAPTLTPAPPVETSTPLFAPSTPESAPVAGQIDYQPMIDRINALLKQVDYDVGVAFVDILTGQAIGLGRQGRFHAMSTFKGPLAAYYLWLIEQGEIVEQAGDHYFVEDMLTWSSNTDTSCMFKRVGGIPGFNDWLAAQGLSRADNFVYSWHQWICLEHGQQYVPALDERYRYGDPALGLPGNGVLLQCPDSSVPCDKAALPLDLARFYARIYRGQVLSPDNTERWLEWMEKDLPITSMFDSLPLDVQDLVHAYAKNGFHPKDKDYPMNFYHEAGILETPHGAFALAVFMQNNPEWRGTDIHGQIGLLAYVHFNMAHEPAGD
ncbi:MAG: serine hydrolase [Anaerolineae bacterium]|nr:serine hydrolase [Anaerolineae bacterium]